MSQGGVTRRDGPAGNAFARTVHANAGDRGGGGGGSLWTTPRAAARNRASESWRAALDVVDGETPWTEAQRGGRIGLLVCTDQANFALGWTGSVTGAFAEWTIEAPADALAATTTANTHARTARRTPRCAVVFGCGDRPARRSWDAATSASSVASVVGSGVVDKAWSSTRMMVSGRGVASGRAAALASAATAPRDGRFGRAAGGVGGTATATGVEGRFVRSPSARRGGFFFIALAARTSCMARPCMHSSHISSTYIHYRSTGMFRLVLGPRRELRDATRSARRARSRRAVKLVSWLFALRRGQRAGFVTSSCESNGFRKMPPINPRPPGPSPGPRRPPRQASQTSAPRDVQITK